MAMQGSDMGSVGQQVRWGGVQWSAVRPVARIACSWSCRPSDVPGASSAAPNGPGSLSRSAKNLRWRSGPSPIPP